MRDDQFNWTMAAAEPRRVLLVDETEYLAGRVGEDLESKGYDVVRVESASECLDHLAGSNVTGIVMTYSLPDLDGVQLLRSIRITHPNIPLILAPENGSEAIASEAIAAGVTGYIQPGQAEPAVLDRVVNCLEQSAPWIDEESGHRYHHLVEVSPVAINMFDESGKSIWCNQAVLDLLGLDSRDELIGESIFEFIHPDDHAIAEREVQQVTEAKESVGPTQMRLRREDGEIRHIYVSTAIGRFLGDDIGQAIAVDITQMRDTQRELKRERHFIETALDSLSDLFYVINDDREFERWNSTVEEVTPYASGELESLDFLELFVEEDQKKVRESIEAILETGSDTVQATLRGPAGDRIPFELSGRRLAIEDDPETTRIVGIGRDISERKVRERQLVVLERWLRHNIRNDLNVIMGTATQLLEDTAPEAAEPLSVIRRHSTHLLEQADHQREVVELIVRPPSPTRQNVGEIVSKQRDRIQTEYPFAEISVTVQDDVSVAAVPELGDAIGELLENACQHHDASDPSISVTVTREHDMGVIRVVDDGPGLPEIEKRELFAHRNVDSEHHGSGLGLFLVYWVARDSNGTLRISSNSPRGTVVTLKMPLASLD